MKSQGSLPDSKHQNDEELYDFPMVSDMVFESEEELRSFLAELLEAHPLPAITNYFSEPFKTETIDLEVDFFGPRFAQGICGTHQASLSTDYTDRIWISHPLVGVLVHEVAHATVHREYLWAKKQPKAHGEEFEEALRGLAVVAEGIIRKKFNMPPMRLAA